MQLQGQNIVVIGGSTGIGFDTAKLAKENGGNVTIAGRSEDKLRRAAEELGGVRTVVVDVANEAEVQRVFEDLDHVDHVFSSAGGLVGGNVLDTDLDVFHKGVKERIWGNLHVVRAAAPKMSAGSITLMSGQLSSRPVPGTAVTTALVKAVEGLTIGLALELAPIRVNAVAPGLIDTPLLQAAFGNQRDAVMNSTAATLPVKRVGTSKEVAQAVLFLMINGFMTGEVLHVDGGGRYV